MPFAIELRFNPESEKRIRGIWEDAARWHGSSYLAEHGAIPHVALVTGDAGLREVFADLDAPSGVIPLVEAGFFAGGAVAFLKADIREDIRHFHASLCHMASQRGVRVDSNYLPEKWLPHCTIAQNCRENLEVPHGSPSLETSIHSLILVEYPPTRLIGEKTTHPT